MLAGRYGFKLYTNRGKLIGPLGSEGALSISLPPNHLFRGQPFSPENLIGKRHWQIESWKDRLRIQEIIHPHDLLG